MPVAPLPLLFPFLLPEVFLLASSAPPPATPTGPAATEEILVTSESGARGERRDNVPLRAGAATGTVISVFPADTRQTIEGIGSSFTESSAYVLAHLEPERRREVMRRIWGEDGANFSMARTHIGACDFCVDGKYSYADTPDDTDLESFSIAPDRAGFDPAVHPGIRERRYDLLPMIEEALAIKAEQEDRELKIIGSAWTAPAWMKDIETWFIPASDANGWNGTGGRLKPIYTATYADYLMRYLDAYAAEGVTLWGLTPVNEPHGNSGFWESMHFTPKTQRDFIRDHLGPRLAESAHADLRLLCYDQNRDEMEKWTDVILADPMTSGYTAGIAVHWYSSTFKVYEKIFHRVRAKFPEHLIIQTEGCIDNLGVPAGGGIKDKKGFQESGWFGNDEFWWNVNATDWAYTASWAPNAEDHPMYVPVHRYARDLIVGFDNGLSGWVDWNIVLDRNGGPNHVGNFCGAPIMIDPDTGEVHYTPLFSVMEQFSRTIRPGDRAVRTERALGGLDADALHACATVNDDGLVTVQLLNTTKKPLPCALQFGDRHAAITLPANSVQTVRVRIPGA